MELGSEASSSLDSTNHVRFRASAPQASWPFSERLTRWTRPITIEILRPHLKTLHRLEIDETLYPNYDQWWVWALEDVIKCNFSVCLFFFCFSMLFFGGGAEQTGAATLAWWRRWRCASKSCAITCASSRPSSTAPRTSSDCSSRRAPLTRRPSKRSVFFFYFNFSFQSLIFFLQPLSGFRRRTRCSGRRSSFLIVGRVCFSIAFNGKSIFFYEKMVGLNVVSFNRVFVDSWMFFWKTNAAKVG